MSCRHRKSHHKKSKKTFTVSLFPGQKVLVKAKSRRRKHRNRNRHCGCCC